MRIRARDALCLSTVGIALAIALRLGVPRAQAQEPRPTPGELEQTATAEAHEPTPTAEVEVIPLVPTPMAPLEELGPQALGLAQPEQSLGAPEDRVASDDPDDQLRPVVAYSEAGDVYLAVWSDRNEQGPTSIFGRYVDANGNPIGSRFAIALDRGELVQVRVVAGGGIFLVMWREGADLSAASFLVQRVSGSFSPDPILGVPIQIHSPIENQFQGVFNRERNEFLLLWLDPRNAVLASFLRGEVWGRRLSPDGALESQEFNFSPFPANPSGFQVLSAPAFQGDLSAAYNMDRDQYLLTYNSYDCSNLGCNVREEVRYQRLDAISLARVLGGTLLTGNRDRIQWAARTVYDPRKTRYLVVWNDNRFDEGDFTIFGREVTDSGLIFGLELNLVSEVGSQLWPEIAYLDDGPPLPRHFLAWEQSSSPTEHIARGAFLSDSLGRLGESVDLSGEPAAEQRYPQVASDRRATPNFLAVWQHTRPGQSADAHAQFFSALDYAMVDLASPTGGDMVLSLQPVLRWAGVPGADRYIVQWFRATDTGLVGSGFPPVVVSADESRDPEDPALQRFKIPSELTSGLNLGTAGYYWQVVALGQAGATIARSRQEPFQIPPLGLHLGNQYWNQFDELIYRWSEAYDLPPALVKAIIAKEAIGITAWLNGDPPDRSYLYEPAHDYRNCVVGAGNTPCRDSRLNPYRQPGAGTEVPRQLDRVNGKPWSANPSIADFAADPTEPFHEGAQISYWEGLQKLTGCTQSPFVGSDFFRCVVDWFDGEPPVAQYRIMASYGLGQVTYWQHFKEDALDPFETQGAAAPPEVLYDPELNIRLTAKEIADDRCAWQRNTDVTDPESPRGIYLNSGDYRVEDFVKWRQVVAAYNGPDFASPQSATAETYVSRVQDYFEPGRIDRNTQPVDLFRAAVGIVVGDPPSQTYAGSPCPLPGVASGEPTQALVSFLLSVQPQSGEQTVAELPVDFQGDGTLQQAQVIWRGDEDVSLSGSAVVRVYGTADPESFLWESPPMDDVTTGVTAMAVAHPATGREILELDWDVGAHGTRTYLIFWDGASFGFVHFVDRSGVDLEYASSDGGGVFILEDGSLAQLQRGASPFDQSDVSIFAFDGHVYRESRNYVVDRNVLDATAPQSSAILSPLPNEAGWVAVPATLTLSAVDDNALELIRYEVIGAQRTEERLSHLEGVPIEIGEGRWLVRYHAIDVYGNEEAEQQIEILVDETAPVSRAELEGVLGEDGKFRSPVVVSIPAADPDLADGAQGSGVTRIEYSLDGGTTWLLYTDPIVVASAGTHHLLHRAIDLAGNVEVEGRSDFEIVMDEVAPALAVGVRPTRFWPPNGRLVPVAVTIDASDADSGLARITIRVEDEYHVHEPPIEPLDLTGEHVVHRQIVVQLIASRLGSDKNGRVYRFVVEVLDLAGNRTSTTAVVLVPHDQGQGLERK